MNSKIQKKHCEKNFEKDIDRISDQLKQIFGLILFNTLFHQMNIAIKSRTAVSTLHHQNRLTELRKQKNPANSN